ncbi:MAG TPA: hypothetical protein VFS52_04825 [Steroidobacteraceae bacterium]|nr:hypothetical protein [Steroidobacteraceae bacterium]
MGDVPSQQEEALQARALDRIEQGLLPREKPTRMWGGRGAGLPCSLCDEPISASEPEMELEYDEPAPTVRFHLRCQSIWDRARQVPDASQWVSVEREMPPLYTVVEARISLGNGARSLILNVMRVCDGETGPVVWLNATTNSALPESWRPVQWRRWRTEPPAESAASRDAVPVPGRHRRA